MKIAIVIIHNKTPEENEQQIEDLKELITEVKEDLYEDGQPVIGDDGVQRHFFKYYTLNGFNEPHELYLYQIIPFQPENTTIPYFKGIVRPANYASIHAHRVEYGPLRDSDKVGNHPRFFNWGLKRSTDFGADLCIYLEDVKKFDPTKLKDKKKDYEEEDGVKYATVKLLKEKGIVDERKTLVEAVDRYKEDKV